MRRSVPNIMFLLCLLAACSDGPSGPAAPEPPEVFIEGYVTWSEDGSPVPGASVKATREEPYDCDEVLCSYRTRTKGSAETDSAGYYRLSYGGGCVDVRVSLPGYFLRGGFYRDVCPPDEGRHLDMQVRLMEPRASVRGTVTSSVDGAGITGVQVGLYGEIDAEEPIDHVTTGWGGEYPSGITGIPGPTLSVPCEEVLYVQARCLGSCTGWRDSERVLLASDCPEPGAGAVVHDVDFVLDPNS